MSPKAMTYTNPLKDIEILIRSHFGFIYLDTDEEDRVESLLLHLSAQMNLPFFVWSSTKGLRRPDKDGGVYGTENITQALSHVEHASTSALYLFHGLGQMLEDKMVVQRIKDVAVALSKKKAALIVLGEHVEFPSVLSSLYTRVEFPPAGMDDYLRLLQHTIRDVSSRMNVSLHLSEKQVHRLLMNMKGLTFMEARKILTRCLVQDGKLGEDDLKAIVDAKKQIVEKEGLLEYYPVEESMTGIAGMNGLKSWLKKRMEIIVNRAQAESFGLTFPRGILLLGVQGCGKSLCAKAVAMEWSLPLLKFDTSALYNKYIGETEKNFSRAMKTAERMAPVVLWIDEIEKAFASGGEQDGGVSQRVLGNFLMWMQERKADVFVIATANDIERLPPEFLRKGRFDEIFFVDLPTPEARQAIFEIHLKKRGKNPSLFDIVTLVQLTDGFSGAEIEQVVVSSLYTAFSSKVELTTELLANEIRQTRPLSVTMAEKITALRQWASTRTVSAN